MNKQELFEKIDGLNKLYGETKNYVAVDDVLNLVKLLDEPQKVTVPQFVADYIKYTKDAEWDLQEAMDDVAYEDNKDLRKWFNNNIELFARAWLDGYTVEKEKRYIVKVKNIGDGWEYLKWNSVQQYWYFGNKARLDDVRLYHTLENLQKGGFGNVFVNPLFTIEEVQDDSKI